MRKEVFASIVLVTVLFLSMGLFILYLENNVYPEIVQLSPGGMPSLNIFYGILGVLWAVITLIILLKNRRDMELLTNRQV